MRLLAQHTPITRLAPVEYHSNVHDQPPVPSEQDGRDVHIFAQDRIEVSDVATAFLSFEVEAAAEEAAQQRERLKRDAALDWLLASLFGTGAVAAATIGALGVAGVAALGPLLAAAAGLLASFAVSMRLMNQFVASLLPLLQRLLPRTASAKPQPMVLRVRPSVRVLGEQLAAQRIALQDLSPRHREVTRA